MFLFMSIVIVFIGAIALAGTLYVGKQVNETIKTAEIAEHGKENDILKNNYYKNPKSNIKIMLTIYSFLILSFIVGLTVYVLFFK